MANEFFVDHGAYGLTTNRIGLDAPTWGVPQEGDGFSTGAATAAGVAEIQIIASPTAAETLLIAGATITAGAAAAANVFVRGVTPDATATNIVTLINGVNFTAVVSTSVVAATTFAATANQGRNLFYARVKPGATDTVQIMWRIGSVALNHATNSAVAISSASWASAPVVTQFIGGTSGCWGWVANPAAIGQGSSIALLTYGILFSRPTVIRIGSASNGTLSIYDLVWLRTGSGQTVTLTITSNVFCTARDCSLVADTNTKWTGDSGTGVFEVRINNTTTFALTVAVSGSSGNKTRLSALRRGGLKSIGLASSTGSTIIGGVSNTKVQFHNLTLEEDVASVGTSNFFPTRTGNTALFSSATDCDFEYPKATSTGRTIATVGAVGGYISGHVVKNCNFNFNYTGIVAPTIPLFAVLANALDLHFYAQNCSINGLGAYTQPFFSNGGFGAQTVELVAENISGSTVDVNGLAMWYTPTNMGFSAQQHRSFISNPDLGGSWRLETAAGAADWVYGAGFPVLAGLSPGGIANSVRIFWLPTPNGQDPIRGFSAPFKQQSRGTTGTKTITLEVFVPSAITYDFFNTRFELSYVDNTGALRFETKTGADLVSSSASWTNAGSYSGHVAKKIGFTTAHQVKQYTDVSIDVGVYGDCPTGTLQFLFVDPGYAIA